MHYTSIEQSEKLLKLGLNPESADMFYNEEPEENYYKYIVDTEYPMIIREGQKHYLKEYGIPCWSLDALLKLIPHTGFDGIEINNFNDGKTIWTVIFRWKTDNTLIRIADTPLDAVYAVVVWLLENNYISRININYTGYASRGLAEEAVEAVNNANESNGHPSFQHIDIYQ